jgi:hypothetical protein
MLEWKVLYAGLQITSVLDLDHKDYVAKHLKAVVNFCDGQCTTCQNCSKLLPTDQDFFSCFDCERFPPAYGDMTCTDITASMTDQKVKAYCTYVVKRVQGERLIEAADTNSEFREKMKAFYNGNDPMGRYRTAINKEGEGRVCSQGLSQKQSMRIIDQVLHD